MRAGFANMNDLTVIQASQGLAVYVEKTFPDAKSKGVVIGYDGRHNSHDFAHWAAATFASRGFKVYLFGRIVPTPLVAFGVLAKKTACGIMVTASHNPKDDNGYKVYWDNGAQIVEPHDKGISEAIEANLQPWGVDPHSVKSNPLVEDPTDSVLDAYFKRIQEWSFHSKDNASRDLKIVYTAMHGVGKECATRAFAAFNLKPFHPVPQQIEPHPDFPTVPFPNPEEGKGALKLSMELGDKENAPIVIANDPDADRLAAAERQPNGQWRVFNGNELGILIAHWSWTQYKAKHPDVDPAKCFVVASTVSSKMLQAMAKAEGLKFYETLTGFKWIGNKAIEEHNKGNKCIFCFEEAIGYMVGDACWDKDGIRAAAVFGEFASWVYAHGKNVSAYLDDLYAKYGFFATNNRYFFCYEPEKLPLIFGEMRNGGKYVDTCGRFKISSIRDLTTPGYDSTQPDKKPILPVSRGTEMITFHFENGAVATLRGSGTEPKLKYYTELPGAPGVDSKIVEAELSELVQEIIKHFLQPEKWGLQKPKD
eukprot:TRINITY_DN420_c0_g1_i1.p1 TRINITY_DN420_c0_g1~~TRINITY_DN420_c0_g1_i1.p1  ORF type:complete len:536 (+),score=130.88 TRINITY_DN420_c0_g1_i1:497-2104(+)